MTKVGGCRQYLVIDLATEQWAVHLIPASIAQKYLGGEALGLYLWSHHSSSTKTVDDEPLCFVLGALTGSSASCATTLTIVGRSPATGLVESSTKISPFSSSMVSCGWQAIILLGSARRQMTLHLFSDAVEFRPSERLIGKSTRETIYALRKEPSSSILCIGPAGEQDVSFATIVDDDQALDRFGFGSTMGKKHIKALVVLDGEVTYQGSDPQQFDESYKEIHTQLKKSRFVERFSQSGPLYLLENAQQEGFAAVENVTKRTDPRIFHLSGAECARKFALEISSCEDCVLCCKRYVMRPGGKDTVLPGALEMMALGSNIGNYDSALVMLWRSQCIDLGLDPISTGMVIGCLMAVNDSGGSGNFPTIRFGDVEIVPKVIELIGHQVSQGVAFKLGSKAWLQSLTDSQKIHAYDCQVYGREMSPIDPRGAWGQALLLGLREDFPLVPELVLRWLPSSNGDLKADWVVFQENLLAMIRSLGLCDELIIPIIFEGASIRFRSRYLSWFYRGTIAKQKNLKGLHLFAQLISSFTGIEFNEKTVLDVGRRAILLKRKINGNDAYPARIPDRFLIDPESSHEESVTIPYTQLLSKYWLLRTLDLANIEVGED